MNKKGLSPAIATVLLISLALILATLIFIWASSLIKEKNQKFGEPIENACDDIVFIAEAYGGKLHVANKGKVPIQGFEIKKKTEGSIENLGTIEETKTLGEGESYEYSLGDMLINIDTTELIVTPIIYGLQKGQRTAHVCDSSELNIIAEGVAPSLLG
jgi:FlaG/FlaF family flagellin (archaellin)